MADPSKRLLEYLITEVWQRTPFLRDHTHNDENQWADRTPINGVIRTICTVCRATIGYRPVGKKFWKTTKRIPVCRKASKRRCR